MNEYDEVEVGGAGIGADNDYADLWMVLGSNQVENDEGHDHACFAPRSTCSKKTVNRSYNILLCAINFIRTEYLHASLRVECTYYGQKCSLMPTQLKRGGNLLYCAFKSTDTLYVTYL